MSDEDLSTWRENDVICPYCKTRYHDTWEMFEKYEDESCEIMECDVCNKKYQACISIDTKFSTYKIEEE